MLFERSFETGRISVMKGSRRVLVKVVLFQLTGCGLPQYGATPNSFLILNALYKGFQMRYHLFLKFFGKMVKIKETSFLSTKGMIMMFGNCIGGMPWVWRGRIHKCRPIFWEIGAQCGPTAAGRRSALIEPQFRRMRSAFMDVPEPDSWHSHCY